MIRGRCLCGEVRFTLEPPTDFVGHCHCASCRRATGAAFATWTSVPDARFTLHAGALTWYRSSPVVRWGFCSTCGSTLFYVAEGEPAADGPRTGCVYVAVGSLVDPLDQSPSAHVSFEEHAAWFLPHDALPKHRGKTAERMSPPATLVILYVADLARARAFYAAVLARAPLLDAPGMVEFELPGALLGLMPAEGISRLLPTLDTGDATVSRAELYLTLPDAEAAHARALAAGAHELSPFAPRPWGDRVAYSRDPDGHVLALHPPQPQVSDPNL